VEDDIDKVLREVNLDNVVQTLQNQQHIALLDEHLERIKWDIEQEVTVNPKGFLGEDTQGIQPDSSQGSLMIQSNQ
jgi:hypothetical protein